MFYSLVFIQCYFGHVIVRLIPTFTNGNMIPSHFFDDLLLISADLSTLNFLSVVIPFMVFHNARLSAVVSDLHSKTSPAASYVQR